MGKAFIEMRYRSKKFKLNADDIGKLYRICKRKTPAIPTFEDRTKIQTETDDDVENASCVNAWIITKPLILIFSLFFYF